MGRVPCCHTSMSWDWLITLLFLYECQCIVHCTCNQPAIISHYYSGILVRLTVQRCGPVCLQRLSDNPGLYTFFITSGIHCITLLRLLITYTHSFFHWMDVYLGFCLTLALLCNKHCLLYLVTGFWEVICGDNIQHVFFRMLAGY